jgi:DNA-binding response OmpR family regulator
MTKDLLNTVLFLHSAEEAKCLSDLLGHLKLKLNIIIADQIENFISIITSKSVDCFIIDWNYENLIVAELIEKLRKSNKFRETPIVIIVDKLDSNILIDHSSLNLDMEISRPFNLNLFQNQLTFILNKKLGHIIPPESEVLIIEDDPSILEIHIEHLKQLKHFKYQTCMTLAEAKNSVDKNDFDILLLDWNLGDGTCIELIEYIRSKKDRHRLNSALIMIITGRDDVEDIMTLLNYDIKDHIIKPFDFSEFEEKLVYGLERHYKIPKKT